MTLNSVKEKQIKKKLKRNHKLSLIGFVVVTASAIVAFYTFPSLSTAGWIAIIFAFVTALCWFLPLAMAAAEMATVRGWTHGGIFTWVRNMIGPRWGFLVNWLQFQVTLGFVAMVFFVLTSFGFSFAGPEGYNYINSLKLGTTLNQSTNLNYSETYNRSAVFGIGIALLVVIMGLSLFGQHKTHQLGQLGFTIGILAPFLVVTGFSIYTVATMKDPLAIIGASFQKNHHLDLVNMGDSFILNKQFMSSTVMASFMAFMFSLHGVEVSAVAANRMKNPSKMYPRAMSIVVAMALICAVLGSITISMTVPTPTLSFTGGLVQSMLFSLSVTGVDVNGVHYSSLADAFAQIESTYGPIAAETVMHQFIYGASSPQQIIDPITNEKIVDIFTSKSSRSFIDGIRAMSFFVGFGVFVEIAVWTSNLSNGLCYAMEKQHFHKISTYRLKNGSPLTLTIFCIFMICIMFTIFTYSYADLDQYAGKTFTDVLSPIGANGKNFANIDAITLQKVQSILQPLYISNPGHQSVINHSVTNDQINLALDQIKNTIGFYPVASGTPASETNIAFISNVIMQISTYFVGYLIFLSSYIKFAFKAKSIHRQFKIKFLWLQITFAILAMATTSFAAVATYLPAAPELYPGQEVYFNFLYVSLPTYAIIVLLGITIYQINKLRLKKLNLNVSEAPKISEGTLEQYDLILNQHFYISKTSKIYYDDLLNKINEIKKELNILFTSETINVKKTSKLLKQWKQLQKEIEQYNLNVIQYNQMTEINDKLNELYLKVDEMLESKSINEEYDLALEEIEEKEMELYKIQSSFYKRVLNK